jgi:predicted nuclease of predicted toxin-antitoxin system
MKLLLDQNLSHRLVKNLQTVYPESSQVALLAMGEATDQSIWDYAREEGYVIVTQDADFHEYSLLYGGPPLVIWLKCGNQPKAVVLSKLLNHRLEIESAALNPDIWCLEIY